MSHRPSNLAPGCVVLTGGLALLVYRASTGDTRSWFVLGGLTLGLPLLVGGFLFGLRARALRPARALAKLAKRTAEQGAASTAERERADELCAAYRAHCNGFSDTAAHSALLSALLAGGPLRGVVAHALVARCERNPELDAALEDLSGIESLEQVAAVARWLRASSTEPRERLVELLLAAPAESRRDALSQLLPLCDPPGAQWISLIQPFAREVEGLLQHRAEGSRHPIVKEWADVLRDLPGDTA